MRLAERIQRMIDGCPEGSSVTLSVDSLRAWLDDQGHGLEADLTVEDVAAFFRRSPVTVRSWIRHGKLRAYKLNGRDYRITRAAVEQYQKLQARGH